MRTTTFTRAKSHHNIIIQYECNICFDSSWQAHLIVSFKRDQFTSGQKEKKFRKSVDIYFESTLFCERRKTFIIFTVFDTRTAFDRSLKLNIFIYIGCFVFLFLRSFDFTWRRIKSSIYFAIPVGRSVAIR